MLNYIHKNKIAILILLLLVTGLNFYFFGYLDHKIPKLEGDEGEYNAYATNIIQNGKYTLNDQAFSAWREPGYIFFISSIYGIYGVGNFRAIHVAQAILVFITSLLIYSIFVRQKQETLGLLGALSTAGNPYFAHLSARLLPEIFFTLIVVIVFYLIVLISSEDKPKPIRFITLGLILGTLILTRLHFMYFTPLLILAVYIWQGSFSVFTGKNALRLFIYSLLPLLLWGSYVMSQTGKFMLQESRVDIQLYVRAQRVQESWPELIKYSGLQIQNTLFGKNDPWWWQKDYRYIILNYDPQVNPISNSVLIIATHPIKYLLGNITEFLKLVSIYHAFNAPHFSKYIRVVWYTALYSTSFLGILICWKRKKMPDTIMISALFLIYNGLIISCFNAEPRYNVPFHIFYFVIGLTGINLIKNKQNDKTSQ